MYLSSADVQAELRTEPPPRRDIAVPATHRRVPCAGGPPKPAFRALRLAQPPVPAVRIAVPRYKNIITSIM